MSRPLSYLFAAVAVFILLAPVAQADEPAGSKIRILLTYGGHAFEEEPFFAMFDRMPGVEVTRAELPRQADLLKPGLEKKIDVIVRYDMVRAVTPEQQKAFIELLGRGIGLVSLHHNLGAHRDWDEYRKIIGGKFVFGDTDFDGKTYTKTPWSHGEDLAVAVADKKHAITRGVDDFQIHDETYGRFYVADGVHVLLTTNHPKNNKEVAWTTRYGKSPVCYLMLGHDHLAWENPAFPKLVEQAIHWAAGE